jgi:hypothetical protein
LGTVPFVMPDVIACQIVSVGAGERNWGTSTTATPPITKRASRTTSKRRRTRRQLSGRSAGTVPAAGDTIAAGSDLSDVTGCWATATDLPRPPSGQPTGWAA